RMNFTTRGFCYTRCPMGYRVRCMVRGVLLSVFCVLPLSPHSFLSHTSSFIVGYGGNLILFRPFITATVQYRHFGALKYSSYSEHEKPRWSVYVCSGGRRESMNEGMWVGSRDTRQGGTGVEAVTYTVFDYTIDKTTFHISHYDIENDYLRNDFVH